MRTDPHSPKNIDPAAYTYAGMLVHRFGGDEEQGDVIAEAIWEDLADTFGEEACFSPEHLPDNLVGARYPSRRTCDHCGAAFNYGAVFEYEDGGHIVVGHTCAQKTFTMPDRATRQRKLAEAAAKRARSHARGVAWATENGLDGLYEGAGHSDWENGVLRDMAAKLSRYGSLSEKQVAFAKKMLSGELATEREARDKERAQQEADTAPIPRELDGQRTRLTGAILSTKEAENYYGIVTKMLFRDDRGFKVWGTMPGVLRDVRWSKRQNGEPDFELPGLRFSFRAKVKISDRDETFGFFSRPACISLEEGS